MPPKVVAMWESRERGETEMKPGFIYVGRPSPWGNPFKLTIEEMRGATLDRFRTYAMNRLKNEPTWLDPLKDAEALVCWCAPRPCHANILVELMNDLDSDAGTANVLARRQGA